ncbi:Synrg [Acrasis kona]|uniref:Synrg n=1 Tax=Acrasis kona TaxID=1008807 RepID=A0AAW2YSH5_9EUKA
MNDRGLWDYKFNALCDSLNDVNMEGILRMFRNEHPKESSIQLFSMDDVVSMKTVEEDEEKLAFVRQTTIHAQKHIIKLGEALTRDKRKKYIDQQQFEERCNLLQNLRDKLNDLYSELEYCERLVSTYQTETEISLNCDEETEDEELPQSDDFASNSKADVYIEDEETPEDDYVILDAPKCTEKVENTKCKNTIKAFFSTLLSSPSEVDFSA